MRHCGDHGWYGDRNYCPECVRQWVTSLSVCLLLGVLLGLILVRLLEVLE